MKYVLIGGSAALMFYEIYTATGPGKTISEIIWLASDKSKAIPFFFGLLMGHLFMPQRMKLSAEEKSNG